MHKLLEWAGESPAVPFGVIASRGFLRPFLLPERLMAALPDGYTPLIFQVVQWIELGLVMLGLCVLVIRVMTAEDRRPYLLLALWYAFPFALVPRSRVVVLWYYFEVLYPAPFLAIGLLTQSHPKQWLSGYVRGWQRRWLVLSGGISALMVVQVSFLLSFAGVVSRTGIFPFPPEIILHYPNPQWRAATPWVNMPLRFRKALRARLLHEFGVDHPHLEPTAHGAVYQLLREDKGFLSRGVMWPTPLPHADPALHNVLLLDNFPGRTEQGREIVVEPYRIVVYHPMMRYDSWRWTVRPEAGWQTPTFDDTAWAPVRMPARQVADPFQYDAGSIPYAQWPPVTIAFRGWIDVPAIDQPMWLGVNIRAPYSPPHTVQALRVNGLPMEPGRTMAYNNVSWNNFEVQAEITWALHPGANPIAFEVGGAGGSFDLDIYGLRSAPPPAGGE